MRALRRLAAMQATTEEHHTLTLAWSSPGTDLVDVGGLMQRPRVDEGATPGKVQARSRMGGDTQTQMVNVAGVELPIQKGALHIGIHSLLDAAGQLRLQIGWECEVTAIGPHDDPALLGTRFQVVDVPKKSHATARRLDVVDITRLTEVTP